MEVSCRMRRVSCCRCSKIFFTAACCCSFRPRFLANTLTRSSMVGLWPRCATAGALTKRTGNIRVRNKSALREQLRGFVAKVLLQLGKARILHPWIDGNILNLDHLWLLDSLHFRLHDIGYHQAAHRLVHLAAYGQSLDSPPTPAAHPVPQDSFL